MVEKILVTGGAGYIGSHTCLTLCQHGYDLVVVDDLSNGYHEAIRRVERLAQSAIAFYQVSLRNTDALNAIFAQERVDAVVHFAGLKAVGESVADPLGYYDINVGGTLSLLRAMERVGLRRLVFSSSATVYGDGLPPYRENFPLAPANPYGHNKQMIEQMLRDQCAAHSEWRVAILRYFNPAGAHTSGEMGECPQGTPSNLMPYLLQVASGKRAHLRIFGGDYPTADGTGIRDYVHVMDLAEGHAVALEKLAATQFLVSNIGTGKGCSVLEMIATFEKVNGVRIPYEIVDRRLGDSAVSYADVDFARQSLGWEAKRGVGQMCEDSWHWQQRYPNGYG